MKTWITALLIVCTTAQARLGETPAQLAARFGKPLRTEGNTAYYEKNGIRISASGWNGVCCEITYEIDGFFTDAQSNGFLASNLPAGRSWIRDKPNPRALGISAWSSDDKRYRAVYSGGTMSFSDYTLILARQAARDAAQNNATSGF